MKGGRRHRPTCMGPPSDNTHRPIHPPIRDTHTHTHTQPFFGSSLQVQRVYREQSRFWTTGKQRAMKRWLLTALLGVLIGCLGVGMTYVTSRLVRHKFRTVTGGWVLRVSCPACARVCGTFHVPRAVSVCLCANPDPA